TSRRAGIPEADTPPRNRPLLATPRPGCEVRKSSAAAARRPGPTMAHEVDCSYVETRLRDTERRMMAALELKDRAAVRAEIEVLRSERLAYEQEGIQTRKALSKSEAYCRALKARVAVLETHARRLEWQRQAADDFAVQHIMREVKKLEIELWNLKVRDNNIPAYTNRFQELTLICTKFVSNETEKVDKYISGLPDNIYGNVVFKT
nr:reverse transcriptase domain-containing protein [Tanacetum cinerariifolium]